MKRKLPRHIRTFQEMVFCQWVVVNTSVPHLGSSPDKRVYDPTEVSPWGLLELNNYLN